MDATAASALDGRASQHGAGSCQVFSIHPRRSRRGPCTPRKMAARRGHENVRWRNLTHGLVGHQRRGTGQAQPRIVECRGREIAYGDVEVVAVQATNHVRNGLCSRAVQRPRRPHVRQHVQFCHDAPRVIQAQTPHRAHFGCSFPPRPRAWPALLPSCEPSACASEERLAC
jgi:hypothetical protein